MKQTDNEQKGRKLLDAFSSIDDDIINEAEEYKAETKKTAEPALPMKKSHIKLRRIFLSAAAFMLIAALLITSGVFKPSNSPTVPEDTTEPRVTTKVFDGSAFSVDDAELPDELKNVNVSSEGSTPHSLSKSGRLIIETDAPCTAETLTKYVSVYPQTDMSVTKLADNKYSLTPANGGFTPGTVYKVTVGSPDNPTASYAFQTETEVCIKSILPSDKSTNVPVNTGIEITFTESVKGNDFSKYISLTPETNGRFELYPNGRTVAFIPEDNLDFLTFYTLEVKKGIVGASGKKLENTKRVRFCTADPDANTDRGYLYISGNEKYYDLSAVFSPGENVSLNVYTYGYNVDEEKGMTVNASVYKFKTFSDAEKAVINRINRFSANDGFSVDGLEHTGDYSMTKEKGSSAKNIDVGSSYKNGVYLVKLHAVAYTAFGFKLEADGFMIFQVSDLRSYVLSSDGKNIVWINEKLKGGSEGASVSGKAFVYDPSNEDEDGKSVDFSGKTDKDGLFIFEAKKTNCAVFTAEKDGQSLLGLCLTEKEDECQRYLSTVYTDRETYFSNDKVNFRGYLAPAYKSVSLPKELYLQTSVSSKREKLVIDASGTFVGSYDIEDLAQGSLFLRFVNENDETVAYKYVSITEEEKPQITAEITFDKLYYKYNETMGVTLYATFFDGTPAEGFEFTFSCYPFQDQFRTKYGNSPYVTDKEGKIFFEMSTGYVNAGSTDPVWVNVSAELTGMETQRLMISKSVRYFHSDYVYSFDRDDDKVTVKLNYRDYSKLKTEEDFSYAVFPENSIGAPANGSITYTLKKETAVPHTEIIYDEYTKKKYSSTSYEYEESTVKRGKESFSNGIITLPLYECKKNEDGRYLEFYWYELVFNDRNNTYINNISASKYKKKNNEYNNFSLERIGGLKVDKTSAVVGDTVKATVEWPSGNYDNALFILFSDGIHSYKTGTEFDFTFDSTMVPSADLYAVYFGKKVGTYGQYSQRITYDFETAARITPTVTADKDKYLPGETATLKIKAGGASGGTALISIVDEACFALEQQDEDTLSSVFSSVGDYFYSDYYYYSYYYKYDGKYTANSVRKPFRVNAKLNLYTLGFSGGSRYYGGFFNDGLAYETAADVKNVPKGSSEFETDEGDGYYIRKYFADNPVFKTVILDENGEGMLTFTVPDNLTTWRATVSVISGADGDLKNLKAGSATSGMICTQPFFITVNGCEKYVSGDDAAFGIRAYGTGADGIVVYTASLTDENVNEIGSKTAESEPLIQAQFNFGKLAAGHYVLTVKGKCGEYKDALEKEFDVIAGSAVETVTADIGIKDVASLKPALYPVKLMFYDGDALKGYFGYYGGYSSERADSIAARYALLTVSDRLNGTDSSDEKEELKKEFKQFIDSATGLVKLIAYGSGDAELTSLILTLCPELFTSADKAKIVSSFGDSIASKTLISDANLCAKLLGLASCDEPVLELLYEVSAQANDYSTEAKLYLAAAFAASGDYSAANSILSEIVKEYGVKEKEHDTLYLKADTNDDRIRLASLAVFTAARVSKPTAEALMNYLDETYSKSESHELANAMYVKHFAPDGKYEEKKAMFSIGGEDVEITVKGNGRAFITLSKSDLATFKVKSADSGIKVRATYTAAIEETEDVSNKSGRIKIKKEIEHYKGDIYKVTLNISGKSTRRYEYFSISDTIPSGARYFATMDDNYDSERKGDIRVWTYAYNPTGQKILGGFSVYNWPDWRFDSMICDEYEFEASVSYYIRGALDGNFVVESAMIRDPQTNYYAKSDRMSLTISDKSDWKVEAFKAA